MTLLAGVAGTCPDSARMTPIVSDFCRKERIDPLFTGDDTQAAQHAAARRRGRGPGIFVNDPQIGCMIGADRLPFAVLIDAEEAIVARGMITNREHLDSLPAVREAGLSRSGPVLMPTQ